MPTTHRSRDVAPPASVRDPAPPRAGAGSTLVATPPPGDDAMTATTSSAATALAMPTPTPLPHPARRWHSADLFGAARDIEIVHGASVYRLRLTSLNKLILTK